MVLSGWEKCYLGKKRLYVTESTTTERSDIWSREYRLFPIR
jgi:hypothetical protein